MFMVKCYRCVLALLAAILVVPGTVHVQSGQDGRTPAGRDWPLFGGDWSNSRHSTLSQINTSNVKTLGGAWTMKFDANASTRATPIVKDGIMFISAGSRLYALNAKTGAPLWTWRPAEAAPERLESAGIGDLLNAGFGIPNPPGVALGEGMVFVGLMDGSVAALRQKTGEVVWTRNVGYEIPKTGQAVSGSPSYADGVVYAGLANGDWAFRGKALALDAKTGSILWEFYTIPGPGEAGHNTWPNGDPKFGDIWKQGGAGVWHPPTPDPDLGLVYYITGNAVPMFGGEARRGNNLYTGSVLALEMKTGKLRWHYQVVHHDLWDADIAMPHVLYDTTVNGLPRKGLGAMRADGHLFLIDRETGKPLLPIEERPVTQDRFNQTSPTQPFPVGGEGLAPPCDYWKDKVKAPFVLDCGGFTPPFLDKHNVVAPGSAIAGVNRVTPMSYSPQTGFFYAQGSASVGRARRISSDPWFRGNAPMLQDLLPPSVNVLAAIDSRTNKIAWKKELPPGPIGTSGPLTTAGGLMFRGDPNGNVQAYDAKTGDLLWEFQTGVGSARGPAASYEVDGEQHVALAMGTALFAFKLGGTLQPGTAPRPGGRVAARGEETNEIETATLVQSADRGVGSRYAMDEHAFNPVRARVKADRWLTFVNNGSETHTIAALDGSFSVATLKTAESASVKIAKAGTYRYACKEHPWAVGEVTVEP
jgi:alcohol dehydrogenase (cytochrome c)